jgi:type II secretory pathway component GspD/PulD (secretin)
MKKILVSFLMLTVAGFSGCPPFAYAQSVYQNVSLDQTSAIEGSIRVPNGEKRVSLDVTGESIRDVLHQLAQQAGFNLLIDDSVTGNVTVDLHNVTINQALDSVAALSDLKVLKQNGGVFLAIGRQAAQDKGLTRQLSKVIKIYYSNANRIAGILNKSLFADSGQASGSSTQAVQKAKADPRTNTLIVVGTAQEIALAEAAVTKLDVPRQSKTFYLSHANALDLAAMLSSSIFNDGTAALKVGSGSSGSSGSSTGGTGGASPSSLRVERQDVQEGTGISSFGSGGSSGSSGGVSSGLSSNVTLRGFVKATDTAQVSPEGPLVIPDTRQNAVTIMGTAEQIAMAESLIPILDAQLPQVSIEASLVEISSDGVKQLSGQLGLADGRLQGGFNNTSSTSVGGVPNKTVGMPTVETSGGQSLARTGLVFSTDPVSKNTDYLFQLKTLIQNQKAKVLANPTVVATHDTESIISIVDEVVRRVTTQLDTSGFATQTVEIGEAGIILDILPKVGEDGTVSMRLRPSVTSVLGQPVKDAFGNLVTLLSKRDLLTQNVRIRDGETLVIGGLIQESNTMQEDKLPLVGELPILGAMFRASQRNNHRSELVLLITPHILSKTRPTPVNTATSYNAGGADLTAGGSQ